MSLRIHLRDMILRQNRINHQILDPWQKSLLHRQIRISEEMRIIQKLVQFKKTNSIPNLMLTISRVLLLL